MFCLLGGFLGILIVRTIVHHINEKYQGDFFLTSQPCTSAGSLPGEPASSFRRGSR